MEVLTDQEMDEMEAEVYARALEGSEICRLFLEKGGIEVADA